MQAVCMPPIYIPCHTHLQLQGQELLSKHHLKSFISFFLMPDLGDKKELEVIVQQSNQQRANMEEMITGGN